MAGGHATRRDGLQTARAMEKFKVTVTYGDQSKKIPLVVTPGRELSGFQREEAHKHLKRTVRSVFSLPPGAEPAFYDRSSGSRMTPRSFTTQSEVFPRRWTLVVESVAEEGANNTFEDSSPPSTVKVCAYTVRACVCVCVRACLYLPR